MSHNHSSHDHQHDLPALFAQRGLRCTRQRLGVFSALAASHAHPTAEELHRLVLEAPDPAADSFGNSHSDRGAVSLATVYNTLEALCRVGLARRLPAIASRPDSPGGARYEACLHQHVHITTPDGVVHDVPDDLGRRILAGLSPDLLKTVERRTGFRVARVDISLFAGAESPVASHA